MRDGSAYPDPEELLDEPRLGLLTTTGPTRRNVLAPGPVQDPRVLAELDPAVPGDREGVLELARDDRGRDTLGEGVARKARTQVGALVAQDVPVGHARGYHLSRKTKLRALSASSTRLGSDGIPGHEGLCRAACSSSGTRSAETLDP